jgi:hypothetical protein
MADLDLHSQDSQQQATKVDEGDAANRVVSSQHVVQHEHVCSCCVCVFVLMNLIETKGLCESPSLLNQN